MGGLFRKKKQYHEDIQLKVTPDARLGTDLQGQILVKAGEKGLRVKSFDCHLVLAEVEVKEEVVDAPMGLTASVVTSTIIWESKTSLPPDTQLEPGETKELPFTLEIPADQSPSEAGEPERRWALNVDLELDAPRPMKSHAYEFSCSQILRVEAP